ncbi:Uncharacterised protein [Mycobacteroides abscessus subsp. abscessus]|uniref:hypothetical protein n=1 Tax=Mycobacteroides abscessus TaxID=36809 RepID=UPI000928E100|nr:hypothetical protein [Mycobacteroides abscessus]SIH19731.1 Uncharacterised protein [Mycobacteroides abscessus subsp. abscessus]
MTALATTTPAITFKVDRTETITYHVDYTRDEVIELLAEGMGDDVRSEYAAMTDDELETELRLALAYGGSDAVRDQVIEASERTGDVQGSTFHVGTSAHS